MNRPLMFKTKSEALYFHCNKKNHFLLSHPALNHFFKLRQQGIDLNAWLNERKSDIVSIENYGTFSMTEIQYYYNKFLMLEENGYFESHELKKKLSGRLSPYSVKLNLANTMQVTLETTDSCNLKCEYCGYGKFYSDYDKRDNKNLDFSIAKNMFDYLITLWNSSLNRSHAREINIGFYGGEPLLNFPLIKEIIEYLGKQRLIHNRFGFGMTTNGLLLGKYMDYLVEKNFKLLISLDGNERNNDYRVFPNGQSAYEAIYKNIITLKDKYPDYFEKNISFNSVLHSKNSVSEIHNFFKNEFNKAPTIVEVSTNGINPAMHKEFLETYQNFYESLNQAEDYSTLEKEMFSNLPDTRGTMDVILRYSGYVYSKYDDLVFRKENESFAPTGTCLPFSRKVFLTVNGKILPCERIGQQHALGYANEIKVEIDFQEIADKYNSYYDKLRAKCKVCYNSKNCKQCIFYLNIQDEKSVCRGFVGEEEFTEYLAARISYLEEHPEIFYKFIKEVTMV